MLWAVCLLLLGIAIGFLIAKNLSKTFVIRFNALGDVTLGANKGDKIEWFYAGQPAPVKFGLGFQPCTNAADPANGTCVLKDSGSYPFKCTGAGAGVCHDPGVGGGDDTKSMGGKNLKGGGYLQPPYATPDTVYVVCDAATSTAKALSTVAGQKGQDFAIELAGPGTDFNATFATAGTCAGGDTLNSGNPVCLINSTVAQPTQVNYSITIGGCKNAGSSTLTVNP
jgi:hypothetical protein